MPKPIIIEPPRTHSFWWQVVTMLACIGKKCSDPDCRRPAAWIEFEGGNAGWKPFKKCTYGCAYHGLPDRPETQE